jgi:hypothetical protein
MGYEGRRVAVMEGENCKIGVFGKGRLEILGSLPAIGLDPYASSPVNNLDLLVCPLKTVVEPQSTND